MSTTSATADARIKVAILTGQHSSLHEFGPLSEDERFVVKVVPVEEFRPDGERLLVLPGSSKTIADLQQFRKAGGAEILREHLVSRTNMIVGICGGYQMLGTSLIDPQLTQGDLMDCQGFGLLPISTRFTDRLIWTSTVVKCAYTRGLVNGEECRRGTSTRDHNFPGQEAFRCFSNVISRRSVDRSMAMEVEGDWVSSVDFDFTWKRSDEKASGALGTELWDGIVSPRQRVIGTYLHQVFNDVDFRDAVADQLV
jgi:adenosylcobyric acid synthase